MTGDKARQSGRRGKAGEDLAAAYLRQKGYEILLRNFRCRRGEIDVIARRESTLVFVEVKLRTNDAGGLGREYVDGRKQRHIADAAISYLHKNPWDGPCRFDVVEIQGDLSTPRITHIEQAFELH